MKDFNMYDALVIIFSPSKHRAVIFITFVSKPRISCFAVL